jgi:hypothetical protein
VRPLEFLAQLQAEAWAKTDKRWRSRQSLNLPGVGWVDDNSDVARALRRMEEES